MTVRNRAIVLATDVEPVVEVPMPAKAEVSTGVGELTHMTVTGFLKFHGILEKYESKGWSGHGRAIAALTRNKGLSIQPVPDARYGSVNAYPIEVLKSYFKVK